MSNTFLSIIIPVYNEVLTLETLLCRIENSPLEIQKEIILVDAGSTDGSTEVIKKYSNQIGFKTLFISGRTGKGLAVREGIKISTGSIVLIQDADLEYDPQDYPALLKPLMMGKSDFVIGSRRLGAAAWNFRFAKKSSPYLFFLDLGDYLLTKFFNFLYGVQVSDPLTMFKIFRRNQIELEELKCNGFDFDWELLCRLINQGQQFVEVPVSYKPRTLAEGKKLRAIREGLRALKIIIGHRYLELHLKVFGRRKFYGN